MRCRIDAIYSRDDGGWYCEVYNLETGQTVHTTGICGSQRAAVGMASKWVEMNVKPESAS